MQKSESIFWGLVGLSAIYVVFTFITPVRANTQAIAPAPSVQAAAQPSMQGMGCMAKGGGCGCGGMMKR